jgi:hypothetical protein
MLSVEELTKFEYARNVNIKTKYLKLLPFFCCEFPFKAKNYLYIGKGKGPGPRRFGNKLYFYSKVLLASSWRTIPCWLSVTAYSIYLQLPSISGGPPSICNLRMCHAMVTRGPPGWDTSAISLC